MWMWDWREGLLEHLFLLLQFFFLSDQVLHCALTVQDGHCLSSCSLLSLATSSEGTSFSFPEKVFASWLCAGIRELFHLLYLTDWCIGRNEMQRKQGLHKPAKWVYFHLWSLKIFTHLADQLFAYKALRSKGSWQDCFGATSRDTARLA